MKKKLILSFVGGFVSAFIFSFCINTCSDLNNGAFTYYEDVDTTQCQHIRGEVIRIIKDNVYLCVPYNIRGEIEDGEAPFVILTNKHLFSGYKIFSDFCIIGLFSYNARNGLHYDAPIYVSYNEINWFIDKIK